LLEDESSGQTQERRIEFQDQELARAVPQPPRRAVREGEKDLHVSETIPKNLYKAF